MQNRYAVPADGVLLSRLEGIVNRGHGQYLARCPAHEDKSPSLSVKETDDGTILIKCFAGCSPVEIVAAVGLELRDLFPRNLDRSTFTKSRRPRHNYKDLLFCLAREATFIALVAEALSKGQTLCDHDRQRLLHAVGKINHIQEVALNG
jgi:hypothetical protein